MQRLAEEFRYTHDEVAVLLGVSRSEVSNRIRLLRLDGRVQHWIGQFKRDREFNNIARF